MKGCGTEVCLVNTYSEFHGEDVDIQVCGEYCPYHKEIHYCNDCEKLKEE